MITKVAYCNRSIWHSSGFSWSFSESSCFSTQTDSVL